MWEISFIINVNNPICSWRTMNIFLTFLEYHHISNEGSTWFCSLCTWEHLCRRDPVKALFLYNYTEVMLLPLPVHGNKNAERHFYCETVPVHHCTIQRRVRPTTHWGIVLLKQEWAFLQTVATNHEKQSQTISTCDHVSTRLAVWFIFNCILCSHNAGGLD